MAFIVITSDSTFIEVQFNDAWNGKSATQKEGRFKRGHISEVIRNENTDTGSIYVSIRFDGEEDSWHCCTPSNYKIGLYPIESVNGVTPANNTGLHDELKKLML